VFHAQHEAGSRSTKATAGRRHHSNSSAITRRSRAIPARSHSSPRVHVRARELLHRCRSSAIASSRGTPRSDPLATVPLDPDLRSWCRCVHQIPDPVDAYARSTSIDLPTRTAKPNHRCNLLCVELYK
jgi:hypothetical protein